MSRCAVEVLADQACDLAAEILAGQAEVDQRRASLDALSLLVTTEHRRLNGQALALPGSVSRALHPVDRQLTGGGREGAAEADWRAAYQALIAGEGGGN